MIESVSKSASAAPDARLTSQTGELVSLSDYWSESPAVVVFVRNFGCAFCKQQVIELRDHFEEFSRAGARVVCVAMGSYKVARGFQILYELPFDILSCGDDPFPYRAFGLTRLTVRDIFQLRVIGRLFVSALRGIFNNPFGNQPGNVERTGAFVIARGGQILFAHRAADVADTATAADMLTHMPAA
jgi:peroxiredoxin